MLKYIPLRYVSQSAEARFWLKVDKTGGPNACWPWTGSNDGSGYGKVKISGILFRAHRVAYFLVTGSDPADRMVCHHCDNPVCCNPAHHFLGTGSENIKDCVAKGRMPALNTTGEHNGAAKLSEADVAKIKVMIAEGETNAAIAAALPVGDDTVSKIRRGKAWGGPALDEAYDSLRKDKP